MDKKQQAHFKAKLEGMSQDILSEAEKTLLEMTDQSDNYPDPTDRATAESNRNFELRIRDRERKLLAKIKDALGVDSELIKGERGVFDVRVDGDLVFSKYEAQGFPDEDALVAELEKRQS